ncbi:MAG: patatin-like phospholipase family protein [Herminiimonas sp.]|nr:patatin-like phospholipase family protein [Herminiimonas sp.]
MNKPEHISGRPNTQRIALVLQGGGALGAYQAGVYQALHEHKLTPDWIVGTSIGAINAAIIAGNERSVRLARLREFWDIVAHPDRFDMRMVHDKARQLNAWMASLDALLFGVPGFYSPRPFNPFAMGLPVEPDAASFYDTSELAETLRGLVDLPYLNSPNGIRLTVSATNVSTGELVNFDNLHQPLGIEHIMASGALPPGFPPIRIDGELYWDGGLYSNTPLEIVLDEEPVVDTLCFMVDLWSATGPEPCTVQQVYTRQKDVAYASRSKHHIKDYLRMHGLRCSLRALHEKIPYEKKTAQEHKEALELGCDTTMHIVRLAYAGRDWQMAWKDINFSKGSIEWRWEQGYNDAMRARKHEDWLSFGPVKTGVVVHEIVPDARESIVKK